MAEITLKSGDFGSETTVTVGEAALYLPDRSRPGLNELVPLTAVAEMESVGDDRTGQLKQAAKLGARGFLTTGNPLGLAASVFAVTKVKDVDFAVRLKDGRSFVATADAGTYANLRAACRLAMTSVEEEAKAAARADAVLAKYLGADALPLDPEPQAPAVGEALPEPGETAEAVDRPAADPAPARPVFGRRGVR